MHKPTKAKVNKAISCLVNAYTYLCPEADRENPALLLREMNKDGTYNPHDYCRVLVSGIYDGLAYGNWPSEINKGGEV